jgi:rhodanese-related sulfurtransferase
MSSTGFYFTKGMVSISSNNKITNLIDRDAILSYYPESFNFGDMYEGEENKTTFEIWDSGCCRLYYSFNWNCSWGDVYPTDGYSYGELDTINITINTTGLLAGLNTCNIAIYSNAGNGSFIVTVNVIYCQIINITIYDAWELLNSTENGIQHPIDVRTDEEWKTGHIDTPIPENPKHYPIDELKNETKLKEFLSIYKHKTIVVYDNSGDNSNLAAQILFENHFKGLIYNMDDGINAWIEAGYPVKSNTPPEKPIITGPTNIKLGIEYTYTFISSDLDQDYLFYEIHWGDTKIDTIGPFDSGETAKLTHSYNVPFGNYSIGTKVIDRYNDESEWGFFDVTIPKNKIITNMFLQRFFQNHPNLFPILQKLLNKVKS